MCLEKQTQDTINQKVKFKIIPIINLHFFQFINQRL